MSRYFSLLERARAAAQAHEAAEPRVALRRALERNPRRLIDVPDRRPRFVVWELTLACNMRCRHCGSAAGKARPDELSEKEALGLCDDLARLGCERLTLLGGEPLLHANWRGLAERLSAGGIRVNLITNGWLTTQPAMMAEIRSAGLVNIGVSVDGLQATHDDLRRRTGSYARVLETFDRAREAGVRACGVTVVTRRSLPELPELHEVLVRAGAGLWQIQIGIPRGRFDSRDPILLRPEDMPRLEEFLVSARGESRLRVDVADNIGYFGEHEEQIRTTGADQIPFWTGCYAGVQVLGIDANGDIKGCASLPSISRFIEGNIRQTPLEEIWNDPQRFAYNRCFEMDQLQGACRTCEHGAVCRGGCRSSSWGLSGSLFSYPLCLYRIRGEKARRNGTREGSGGSGK